jgi:hypothetical protein
LCVTLQAQRNSESYYGRFLVYAVYGAALACAAFPIIGLIVDFDDRGHLFRFVGFWAIALSVAILGKCLSIVLAKAHKDQHAAPEQSAEP